MFDPRELVEKGNKIKSVNIDGYGELKYGQLTVGDLLEVFGEGFTVKNPEPTAEQMLKLAHKMIQKAYPNFSFEDFLKITPGDLEKILDALFESEDFRVEG